jgi:hypothetical protein
MKMNAVSRRLLVGWLIIVLQGCIIHIYAQPNLPQRTITTTATQPIHFGAFCLTGSGGGTVTVGYDGSRSATGDILLFSISPTAQPAIFDIKLCQGRTVTITYDQPAPLTGNKGGSFNLFIGPTEKGTSGAEFPVNNDCNFITTLRVGGTITIPAGSPIGTYSGNFSMTFTQE